MNLYVAFYISRAGQVKFWLVNGALHRILEIFCLEELLQGVRMSHHSCTTLSLKTHFRSNEKINSYVSLGQVIHEISLDQRKYTIT